MQNLLSTRLIRSAAVWNRGSGFLLLCDPAREDDDAHTDFALLNSGGLHETWLAFSAHSVCRIEKPFAAAVCISEDGFFAVNSDSIFTSNLFEDLARDSDKQRYGSVRQIRSIEGRAYAVGLRGLAASLLDSREWVAIEDGLPEDLDLHAIDGFDSNDIYAVGSKGRMSHFDGRGWSEIASPTNITLTNVVCATDGFVYVVGHGGIILQGREDAWEIIENDVSSDDIWGISYFKGELYFASFSSVFHLSDLGIKEVILDDERAYSCYSLTFWDDVLWSVGEKDIYELGHDGWRRLI